MSHNPNTVKSQDDLNHNEIKSEVEKLILEAQKDGYNLCLTMIKNIAEYSKEKANKDSITDVCVVKCIDKIIETLEQTREGIYNDKVAE